MLFDRILLNERKEKEEEEEKKKIEKITDLSYPQKLISKNKTRKFRSNKFITSFPLSPSNFIIHISIIMFVLFLRL